MFEKKLTQDQLTGSRPKFSKTFGQGVFREASLDLEHRKQITSSLHVDAYHKKQLRSYSKAPHKKTKRKKRVNKKNGSRPTSMISAMRGSHVDSRSDVSRTRSRLRKPDNLGSIDRIGKSKGKMRKVVERRPKRKMKISYVRKNLLKHSKQIKTGKRGGRLKDSGNVDNFQSILTLKNSKKQSKADCYSMSKNSRTGTKSFQAISRRKSLYSSKLLPLVDSTKKKRLNGPK